MSLHRAYLLLALLGLVSCGEPPLPPAPQGAWVSSGGELFKDANNPWFVKNTPRVTYCIAVDRDSFSASPETVETLVSKAIGYWKEQFSPYNTYQTSGALGIATQDFVREECQPSTDVRFLLGFGRLPPREAAYVGSTHALISAAVRTDYDEESLRGKGFIYVAFARITTRKVCGGRGLFTSPRIGALTRMIPTRHSSPRLGATEGSSTVCSCTSWATCSAFRI